MIRTKGTGVAGHRSSRWDRRAPVKNEARMARRHEDEAMIAEGLGEID